MIPPGPLYVPKLPAPREARSASARQELIDKHLYFAAMTEILNVSGAPARNTSIVTVVPGR